MRRTVLALLMVAGLASTIASSGCYAVPKEIGKGIADVDSASQANNQLFRRVLTGYTPTAEEAAHAQARMSALDNLTPKINAWAKDH